MEVIIRTRNSAAWVLHNYCDNDYEAFEADIHPDILFEKCLELQLVKNPPFNMYGKAMSMKRSVGFFSDESEGYRYSGQIARSQPLTPSLKNIMLHVNKLLNTKFNGILVNRYEDGSEYISPHSDDESGLSTGGKVAGISLGAERVVKFRGKISNNGLFACIGDHEVLLPHGSLFVMEGEFQKQFTHEIPKALKIKDVRISLTFREHSK